MAPSPDVEDHPNHWQIRIVNPEVRASRPGEQHHDMPAVRLEVNVRDMPAVRLEVNVRRDRTDSDTSASAKPVTPGNQKRPGPEQAKTDTQRAADTPKKNQSAPAGDKPSAKPRNDERANATSRRDPEQSARPAQRPESRALQSRANDSARGTAGSRLDARQEKNARATEEQRGAARGSSQQGTTPERRAATTIQLRPAEHGIVIRSEAHSDEDEVSFWNEFSIRNFDWNVFVDVTAILTVTALAPVLVAYGSILVGLLNIDNDRDADISPFLMLPPSARAGGSAAKSLLMVGPEREREFQSLRALEQSGVRVKVVNPTLSEDAKQFVKEGGPFVEAKVQDLPKELKFDNVHENFPNPPGRTTQGLSEVGARFDRVKPGGRLSIVTEDQKLVESYLAEGKVRGWIGDSVELPDGVGLEMPDYLVGLRNKRYLVVLDAPK